MGLDKQADGGTHVHSTGEIGVFRVVKTESKGKGNKRLRIRIESVVRRLTCNMQVKRRTRDQSRSRSSTSTFCITSPTLTPSAVSMPSTT